MQFNRHLIALSLTAALTQLTACGGGSSDSAPTPKPEPKPTQSLAGATADGYLVNAQVCLDLNGNGECDDNEPSTQTKEKGRYTLEGLDGELDLGQYQMLVKVIAGQTQDEDFPGETLDQAYTMTAPAGVNGFISPLTTLLAAEMDKSGLGQDLATEALAQSLGIQGSELSLVEDYIEGKDDQEKGQGYERLHKVAQVVARVTAKAHKALEENAGTGGDAADDEAADAIANTVAANLDALVQDVDAAAGSGDEINVDAIADQVAEALPLSPEEVQEQVEQNREQAKQKDSQLESILKGEGGMFELDGDTETRYDSAANKCIIERELGYEQVGLNGKTLTFDSYLYQGDGLGFVKQPAEEEHKQLVWKEGSWQHVSDQLTIVSSEEDGSVIIESKQQGRQQVWAKALDLADLKLKRYANGEKAWMAQFDAAERFPEGAQGYQLTFKQLDQRAVLYFDDQCDNQTLFCNQVSLGDGPVATLAELFNGPSDAEMPKMVLFHGDDRDTTLAVALFGSLESGNGEARLYLIDNDRCNSQGCGMPELAQDEQGSWSKGEMGISLTLPEWAHDYLDEPHATPLLTEYQGAVRYAFIMGEGLDRDNEWNFNKVAMDTLIERLGSPSLRIEADASACGFDDGDHQKPDDGDGDDNDGDRPAPQLKADAAATAALTGLRYMARSDDFHALFQFDGNGAIKVWLQEWNSDDSIDSETLTGRWIIDADHQLLMQFGDDDWVLMQLPEQGLGDESMQATEEADGEVMEYAMTLVRPFSVEALSMPLEMRLTGQTTNERCVLDIQLNGKATDRQGTGTIDMGQCADGEDSMAVAKLEWDQTDAGLTLYPLDDAGQRISERHHLYWYGSKGTERVLIRSYNQKEHGATELEALDNFLFQKL